MDAVDEGAALCEPFLLRLPVDGASISVVSTIGTQSTIGVSDRLAAELDERQFELGEGPTVDVMRHGLVVSALDLDSEGVRAAWPVLATAARKIGVRALFAFPMLLDGARVGVVNLYALTVRPLWEPAVLQLGATLTAAAVPTAVEIATRSAMSEQRAGRQQTELRREVHQAAGMLLVQLDCSIDEAMARLRAHAFADSTPIDVVARAVVAGTLRLDRHDD